MTDETSPVPPILASRKRHIVTSLVILVAAIGLVTLLFKSLSYNPNVIPSNLLNKPANPFQVAWIQGKEYLGNPEGRTFSLATFKGKPVVLNFWASWCYSCREEAHDFERFWEKAKDRGIMVVGIAIQDTPEAAKEFAQKFGKTYILGLDEDGHAAIDYGVTGVPETFFIDRTGKIVHKETGPVTTAMLEQLTSTVFK